MPSFGLTAGAQITARALYEDEITFSRTFLENGRQLSDRDRCGAVDFHASWWRRAAMADSTLSLVTCRHRHLK